MTFSLLALAASVLAAAPTTAADTVFLQRGSLFGAYHVMDRPGIDQAAAERFYRRDYFPAWADLIPGSRVYYLTGNRGTDAGTRVFFWLFESLATRNLYYPEDGISTPAYRERRATLNWLYADSTFDRYATDYREEFTDFVVIAAPARALALRAGMVMGLHYIDLKPGADSAAFERFLREEFVPGGGYTVPGATPFFLKGDRGAHKGGFGLLWVFESVEARDRYFPAHGTASDAWRTAWAPWRRLDERLESFIASWRRPSQTDYLIIQ